MELYSWCVSSMCRQYPRNWKTMFLHSDFFLSFTRQIAFSIHRLPQCYTSFIFGQCLECPWIFEESEIDSRRTSSFSVYILFLSSSLLFTGSPFYFDFVSGFPQGKALSVRFCFWNRIPFCQMTVPTPRKDVIIVLHIYVSKLRISWTSSLTRSTLIFTLPWWRFVGSICMLQPCFQITQSFPNIIVLCIIV